MDTRNTHPALAKSQDYGVEILCANWNPVVSAVVEPVGYNRREWVADVSTLEVDKFLQQFYRCQIS